ncbi:hypothetical protein C5167_024713 [Papaver somniferum]|uniref:Knottin scorpion toxin-like domain-containing protein n=1 Tax=Papaver somniferum TaxID=3469 RepID=A0A4Y7JSF4_PAPSO|nr:hypothetical protein C5167_024713 [Papaver somniferum]
MKMFNLTTQLVVALSLCLLLLSLSYSVDATARSIAEAAANDFECKPIRKPCKRDRDCDYECSNIGYDMRGRCVRHHVEKIDVNRYKVINLSGCCCEV